MVAVFSGVFVPLAIIILAVLADAAISVAEIKSYKPVNSNGVPLERGIRECDYQAELATAGDTAETMELRMQCMRLRAALSRLANTSA